MLPQVSQTSCLSFVLIVGLTPRSSLNSRSGMAVEPLQHLATGVPLFTVVYVTSPWSWHTSFDVNINGINVDKSILEMAQVTIDVFFLCSLHYFTKQTAYI